MLPNPFQADTGVSGGETVRLGVEEAERRPGVRDYEVTPPFGPGLVLAILTPVPLTNVGTQETEPAEAFVTHLAAALDRARKAGPVTFSQAWLETRPRE
jgi:hypothetical protein